MQEKEKGHCKHGEFDLMEGCPDCIQEERERREAESLGEEIPVEEQAGPGGPGANTYGAKPEPAPEPEPAATVTALIKMPGADVEVLSYFKEALKLQKYAESRVIATVENAKEATDDLSVIAKLKKAMEEKRKDYLAPLKAQTEAIRDTYNYLMAPVLNADKITRDKMLTYDAEQRRIRAEQEEINRLRIEAARKEMELKGELTESVELVEVAPEVKPVSTNLGTAGQRDNWKWEIIDHLLIPREYLVVDNAQLTAIARRHHDKKQIPGVRFYNEPTIAVRTR